MLLVLVKILLASISQPKPTQFTVKTTYYVGIKHISCLQYGSNDGCTDVITYPNSPSAAVASHDMFGLVFVEILLPCTTNLR
jgi:hypothetical protein